MESRDQNASLKKAATLQKGEFFRMETGRE
jgi:hypothetical protein